MSRFFLFCILLFTASAEYRSRSATFVVTNNADSGPGTFRQALQQANATPGSDVISFNLQGTNTGIYAETPWPTITDPVLIDGYSQPGSQPNTLSDGNNAVIVVTLNAATKIVVNAKTNLVINTSGTVVRGLALVDYGSVGPGAIVIAGGRSNRIEGCFIGIGPGRLTHDIFWNAGIDINSSNTAFNVIGGTNPPARNVIAGNFRGVQIQNSPGNVIQGNLIGTDPSGNLRSPNATGVVISGTNSVANLVGGREPSMRNVISGNGNAVAILDGASENLVYGNHIGTDWSGMNELSNNSAGVVLTADAFSNRIGSASAGAGNLISANTDGILCFQNHGGGTNFIQGNRIGTDVTGTNVLGNKSFGVYSDGSQRDYIGGTAPGAGNVICGNHDSGVFVNSPGFIGTVIQGNFIGTDRSGRLPLGNGHGMWLIAPNELVGGFEEGAGNIIAYNLGEGIRDEAQSSLIGNSIYGNGSFGVSSTFGSEALFNSIFDNGGLGIVSFYREQSTNDLMDLDWQQNYPVVAQAVTFNDHATVDGFLQSTQNTRFRVEFFLNDSCDPSGYGEGKNFLGFTNIMTDSSGLGEFHMVVPGFFAPGGFVTATATRSNGFTSDFSACQTLVSSTSADLSVSIAHDASAVSVASNLICNVYVTNSGPALASGIVVSNVIPEGFAFVSATTSQGACEEMSGLVRCALGSLSEGGAASIRLIVQPSSYGTLTQTVSVASSTIDYITANNSASETTSIGLADLSIRIMTLPENPVAGQEMVISIVCSNRGPDLSPSAWFSFEPPQGFRMTSASSSGGAMDSSMLSMTADPIAAGGSATLQLRGMATGEGDFSCYSVCFFVLADPDWHNNIDTQTIHISEGPGLLSFSAPAYSVGEAEGSITVPVTRTGGALGEVSVHVTAADESGDSSGALSFQATLQFFPGQTQAAFEMPISDNFAPNCDRLIRLILSDATGGAVLFSGTNSFVSVLDDDPLPRGWIEPVSVTSTDPTITGDSYVYSCVIDGEGAKAVYLSSADNVVSNNTSGNLQVYLHDLTERRTTLISRGTNDSEGANAWCLEPAISADGNTVVFTSPASNLSSTGTFGQSNVFVWNGLSNRTELLSVNSGGSAGNGDSFSAQISSNGERVLFLSRATDLISPPSPSGFDRLFYRDRKAGTTKDLLSRAGTPIATGCYLPCLSADGRFVVFGSLGEIIAGSSNGFGQAFVVDVEHDQKSLISAAVNSEGPANGHSYAFAISSNGRYVLFNSFASDVVTNYFLGTEIFWRDTVERKTSLVTLDRAGTWSGGSPGSAVLSDDGRFVVFENDASNLVAQRTVPRIYNIFIRDMFLQETRLVSKACNAEAGGDGNSFAPQISRDGRRIVFISEASNLAPGGHQPHGVWQIYVRDLEAGVTTLVSRNNVDGGYASMLSEAPVINQSGSRIFFSNHGVDLINSWITDFPQIYVFRNEDRPGLSVSMVGNVAKVSWPAAAGFSLQTKSSIDPQEAWTEVLHSIRLEGALKVYTQTNSSSSTNRFFRLHRE
jgi:uncharacterized repeat protein (TIGR01451 family)